MNILVTGGLGYIGAHACVELLRAGHEAVILDNLYNAKAEVHERIRTITGKDARLYAGSVLDAALLSEIFAENRIDAVMHFAGLKSVPESAEKPLEYYRVNVAGTLTLLEAMEAASCRCMIFSSSACVYGLSGSEPMREDFPLSPQNPYGRTKRMVEQILEDLCASDARWSAMSLRYFNPIGAHESGLIGEALGDRPGNLMPYITRVAAGKDPVLRVTGTDFDTPDGSGVRDYIHVTDLAQGHLAALEKAAKQPGYRVYNLGCGKGVSVLEMVSAFERATGKAVPWEAAPRRAGDLAMYFADPSRAEAELDWRTERDLETMCADAWRYAERIYG